MSWRVGIHKCSGEGMKEEMGERKQPNNVGGQKEPGEGDTLQRRIYITEEKG